MTQVNLGGHFVEVTEFDVDLDQEDVRLADGTRLTEAGAEVWAEDIRCRQSLGRPSLSGEQGALPKIEARVSPALKFRLHERAVAEHKDDADIVRAAVEAYLAT